MNSRTSQYVLAFILIFSAALSRLLPHPLNFTPIAAMALFGGIYLDKKFAFILPFIALLITDYIIGFYSGAYWVYGSFALIGVLGLWLKNYKNIPAIIGGTFASSILFFIITNFGVWFSGTMYTKNFSGLMECYIAAIPFFRNTVVGDLFYVGVLFGVYELITKLLAKNSVVKV